MKKIKTLILLLTITIFLNSCNTFSDVGKTLRNEKNKSTDEFLVKKRQPLNLPPDYETLPKPRSKNTSAKSSSDEINKILKIPKSEVRKKGSSSVEKSIINQISK